MKLGIMNSASNVKTILPGEVVDHYNRIDIDYYPNPNYIKPLEVQEHCLLLRKDFLEFRLLAEVSLLENDNLKTWQESKFDITRRIRRINIADMSVFFSPSNSVYVLELEIAGVEEAFSLWFKERKTATTLFNRLTDYIFQ